MTIHPLAWLALLLAAVAVVVVGLCQISRAEARRRREELFVLRRRYYR